LTRSKLRGQSIEISETNLGNPVDHFDCRYVFGMLEIRIQVVT